jgi:hypothetical protein
MRFTRAGLAMVSILALNACGANGILGLNPQPTGGVTITDQQTGKTLTTSLANPFIVSGGSFAVSLAEPHFNGQFGVKVISWTAPFNIPCFQPTALAAPNGNIFQFVAVNAASAADPTEASPCSSFAVSTGYTTDEETATFTDNKGHAVNFFYQIANTSSASGSGSGSATVASITLAWNGAVPTDVSGDPGDTCGAFLLTVTAFNAAGAQIIGQSYTNPITLSTSNYNTSGFSTAVAGLVPAPSPAGETCSNVPPIPGPGGTSTLVVPNTTTPSVVYWQPAAAFSGPTVITATAIGVTPVSAQIQISNALRKTGPGSSAVQRH